MSAIDTANTIKSRYNIPVVFLSSRQEQEIVDVNDGITYYGYILKNCTPTIMIATIKMALKLFESNQQILEREKKIQYQFKTIH